ncbi:MAG: hypothetical protein MJ252_09160, partial [archaeon]|nr:hypothetical protein [archaeon]
MEFHPFETLHSKFDKDKKKKPFIKKIFKEDVELIPNSNIQTIQSTNFYDRSNIENRNILTEEPNKINKYPHKRTNSLTLKYKKKPNYSITLENELPKSILSIKITSGTMKNKDRNRNTNYNNNIIHRLNSENSLYSYNSFNDVKT